MNWSRDGLMGAARAVVFSDKSMRLGQALYNVAYSQNPAIAHLAGTEVDPFYDDSRIEAFLDRIGAR